MERTPVVFVGIDTADPDRIDRLLSEGRMPHLAALRARGLQGTVEPWPPGFFDMVWPSFTTGRPLSGHGWYYGKLWRPERMRLEFVRPSWLPQAAFWERPEFSPCRIGVVDVPFAPLPQAGFQGVYINGWQSHDGTVSHFAPAGLERDIIARFGKPILPQVDPFGPQTPARIRRICDEAIGATAQIAQICSWLLETGRFDLFMVVLGGAHRAGHYAYSLSQVDAENLAEHERHSLAHALDDVYVASDAALGQIMGSAPAGARTLACALHGMGAEAGWSEQFARLLACVQGEDSPRSGEGALYRLKSRVPHGAVRAMRHVLPAAVHNAVIPLWSRRMHDWSRTRCFGLPCDLGGFIRINLRGREREGIVEPGREYDELCEKLTDGFLSFRDIAGGRPVVEAVDRVDRQLGADAPALRWLPDLVVRWGSLRATELEGVRSDLYGEVRWQPGWRLTSGRSGNHRPRGWFVACGPEIWTGIENRPWQSTELSRLVQTWMGASAGSPNPNR